MADCSATSRLQQVVFQAIHIFPCGVHAQEKGGGGREGKIRLVHGKVCKVFIPKWNVIYCFASQSQMIIMHAGKIHQ